MLSSYKNSSLYIGADFWQAAPAPADDDDDDDDLFGSDDDDEETQRIKEERLAAYAAKKAKKPTVIAKSSIVLDVRIFVISLSCLLIILYDWSCCHLMDW